MRQTSNIICKKIFDANEKLNFHIVLTWFASVFPLLLAVGSETYLKFISTPWNLKTMAPLFTVKWEYMIENALFCTFLNIRIRSWDKSN